VYELATQINGPWCKTFCGQNPATDASSSLEHHESDVLIGAAQQVRGIEPSNTRSDNNNVNIFRHV
jgi:hypothetical protein